MSTRDRQGMTLFRLPACILLLIITLGNPVSAAEQSGHAPADPLNSPQWGVMHSRFLNGETYVFDDKVKVLAPDSAEDSLNVPITFDASALQGVEKIVVMADLNPIPGVLEFRPKTIPARLSFRMKLQQGSPVRAAAKTADGVWHVGGAWVDAAGGGCTLPSTGTATGDWSSTLGKVSANVWQRPDNNRLRVRVMHPMDTGLASGIPTFHIEDMNILDESGALLAEMTLHEPISENPMLSLDVGKHTGFRLEGHDNNGNRIDAEVVE
ncbi:MAG: quinoprotein dehydrogenase-associated SoxYZ-like carrier [Gammaproteobacteria bacterium]|nr:quinoprotein dehydrogenase-associated SoxYZ-like carrier [Gammaproteobacteria bacterium]MBU1725641.1 quinoprotein dehydrogenase-associated SoxYZ-like carrier [Gammaproteobacteria bacterium]MBU2004007.1 quinoprotein dehydrogenase-associated SoxYZ-like carrier [Gammaproteobacteria bacterium]